MTNDQPQPDPTPTPAPPTPPVSLAGSVPSWLRTTIVAVIGLLFVAHVGYDAYRADYESFQTSFLLLGFIGLALGIDIMGRR